MGLGWCRWEFWDVDNPQQQPEGLTAEEAWPGFCSVANPALDKGDRRPHLKGVQIPSWGLVAISNRNAVDDHVRFIGMHICFCTFKTTLMQSLTPDKTVSCVLTRSCNHIFKPHL